MVNGQCITREASHRWVRERQVARFNRLWLETSGDQSEDSSGSSKDNGYMLNKSSGHSNHSPPTITTSMSTATENTIHVTIYISP